MRKRRSVNTHDRDRSWTYTLLDQSLITELRFFSSSSNFKFYKLLQMVIERVDCKLSNRLFRRLRPQQHSD